MGGFFFFFPWQLEAHQNFTAAACEPFLWKDAAETDVFEGAFLLMQHVTSLKEGGTNI